MVSVNINNFSISIIFGTLNLQKKSSVFKLMSFDKTESQLTLFP